MSTATKHIALLILLTIMFVLIAQKILEKFNMTLESYPKFQYKGRTPKQDWYNYATPLAKEVGKQYGIPWQAILVQTALETGWGKSQLFQKYNNWGGIKARPGQNSVQLGTVEYIGGNRTTIVDGFRVWETPYQGLQGYAQFFHQNPRYKNALKFPNDPYRFIEEIKKSGYATDPNYVAKLHGMLRTDFSA